MRLTTILFPTILLLGSAFAATPKSARPQSTTPAGAAIPAPQSLDLPLATPVVRAPAPAPAFDPPAIYDYDPEVIPLVRTRIRYVTVIILPMSERILEAVCGDKEYWQITPVENIVYIKPSKANLATNLTIITKTGTLYSFALEEISESAGGLRPQVKVTVRLPLSMQEQNATPGTKFLSTAEHEAVVQDYQRQLQDAVANVRDVQQAAKNMVLNEVTKLRTDYPAQLQFDYVITHDTKPFFVQAMYADGKFTYLKLGPQAQDAPAVYEIVDGKPNLVNFDYLNGVFIIRKIVDQGYLVLGKSKLHFHRTATK